VATIVKVVVRMREMVRTPVRVLVKVAMKRRASITSPTETHSFSPRFLFHLTQNGRLTLKRTGEKVIPSKIINIQYHGGIFGTMGQSNSSSSSSSSLLGAVSLFGCLSDCGATRRCRLPLPPDIAASGTYPTKQTGARRAKANTIGYH
jgi:hypothetical protein